VATGYIFKLVPTYYLRNGVVIFNGKIHLITAVIISYILYKGFGLFEPAYYLFTLLGAILPDLDIRDSIIGRFNPFAIFMTHRGITHTLLAAVLVSLFFSVGGYQAGICMGIGYLSHLWLDSATKSGIRWMYPFKRT
jgi:inner membrane protein